MERNSEQSYRARFDAFMAISEEEVVYCNAPLEVATAEGAQLAFVAAEDRARLLDAGLDPVYVDTLGARVGAFDYAAAAYGLAANADPAAVAAWKSRSKVGFEVRQYLLKFLEFAYRKDAALSQSVANIKEGRGNRDMILDLLSLHILGVENPSPLARIGSFDAAKLGEAKALHDELTDLFARATVDPAEVSEAKRILDRAYTDYKRAADEVKEHGRFVFEGTDRYLSYVSAYRRQAGKSSARVTDDADTTAADTTATDTSK
jgi:hypothetical protein